MTLTADAPKYINKFKQKPTLLGCRTIILLWVEDDAFALKPFARATPIQPVTTDSVCYYLFIFTNFLFTFYSGLSVVFN